MFVLGFPLLLVPFAIYNIVAFIFRLPDDIWTTQAAAVRMMSEQIWKMTWQDIFIAVSILLLLVEVIKSTKIGVRAIIDHVLALLLFIVMLVEFLLVARAETSTFFLLLIITLVDVLAGFIVSIRSSTRQIEVESPEKV